MKRILDPGFRYVPSFATDLRKTFERLRRQRRQAARDARESRDAKVRVLHVPKAGR